MATFKYKTVYYRVAGSACLPGYVDVSQCVTATAPQVVLDMSLAPVAGAVVTAKGDCPIEVVTVAAAAQGPLPPPADYEKTVMCDPATGARVLVITDLSVPTAPVVSYWSLSAGAPFTGVTTGLVQCSSAAVSVESDQRPMCDNGQDFLRWYVKENGQPTGQFYDTLLDGSLYVAGAPTPGACVITPKQFIYTYRNGGVWGMADIVSQVAPGVVQSVTVVQISGTGSLVGDYGGGFPLYANESQTFAAYGTSPMDGLNSSSTLFDAGSGEQHITAVIVG